MKLYVVRHGQTNWNVENKYQGIKDIPLNEIGQKQAIEVANKIEKENRKIDLIISSPLIRTLETAKIINQKLEVEIKEDNRIIERNFGELEGIKLNEERYIINKKMLDLELNYNEYKIETISEITTRVYNFLDEILNKYKDANILLVTHNGVAIMIETYFKGIPEDKDLMKYGLKNCELREYEVKI